MAPDPQLTQTHSNDALGRKPRRLGLYLPWAALVVFAAGWSLAWLWMIGQTQSRLDAGAAALRKAGWTVSWDSRHVGGYPFRLDVEVTGLRLADPSGWGATIPSLKSEAFAFAPANWVFYVPGGLTFSRPDGGPVNVTAGTLRASINGWDQAPPRISVEGDDLTFTAAPGAKPFSLASAKTLQFYTRAGPNQQAALFVGIDGGAALPDSWAGQIAGGKPVAIKLDGIISHTDALQGASWRELITNWSAKGGSFDVHQLTLAAGDAALDARKGGVAVADDGRLEGVLEASLRDENRVLAVAQTGKPPASDLTVAATALDLRFTFRDGVTWIGPLRLAPAPRAY
ncbi:MAG: DUF2125 domain-containing protein [Caulobacteraceae bacterium]